MSGGPLLDAERTDARRFCGYPIVGHGGLGWSAPQGALDHRLGQLSDAEMAVLRSYLGTLAGLESAVPAAGDNLDTQTAGIWSRNPGELADRVRLLDGWRRRLCGFLGVAPGPGLGNPAFVPLVV